MTRYLGLQPGWSRLGSLTWNTHMGTAMTEDMWEWITDNLAPLQVIYLSEVDSWIKLQRLLGPEWRVVPNHAETMRNGRKATTALALKRRRFHAGGRVTTRDIGFGSKHARNLVTFTAVDKQTGRRTSFGSVHTDPLGKGFLEASPTARARHVKQTGAAAAFAQGMLNEDEHAAVFLGGDFNEQLGDQLRIAANSDRLGRQTAVHQLDRAGLTAAFAERSQHRSVKLDDVFAGGRRVRCVQRLQFRPPTKVHGADHLDHDLVYTVHKVKDL